jgi:hypothetical protein
LTGIEEGTSQKYKCLTFLNWEGFIRKEVLNARYTSRKNLGLTRSQPQNL